MSKEKVTVHPSISQELKKTLLNLLEEKIEVRERVVYKEFRSFSQLVEFLINKGLEVYEKERLEEKHGT